MLTIAPAVAAGLVAVSATVPVATIAISVTVPVAPVPISITVPVAPISISISVTIIVVPVTVASVTVAKASVYVGVEVAAGAVSTELATRVHIRVTANAGIQITAYSVTTHASIYIATNTVTAYTSISAKVAACAWIGSYITRRRLSNACSQVGLTSRVTSSARSLNRAAYLSTGVYAGTTRYGRSILRPSRTSADHDGQPQ